MPAADQALREEENHAEASRGLAEYRPIARPDPDDPKSHARNRLRPERLSRKTLAKVLPVLLLRECTGSVRLEQAVSRLRAHGRR